jgi:hypothetical protein
LISLDFPQKVLQIGPFSASYRALSMQGPALIAKSVQTSPLTRYSR